MKDARSLRLNYIEKEELTIIAFFYFDLKIVGTVTPPSLII